MPEEKIRRSFARRRFSVSHWRKFLLSSNLQFLCCKALPSSESNLDCLADGRSDAPAS